MFSMIIVLFGCSNSSEKAGKDGDGESQVEVTPAGTFPITEEKVTLNVMVHGNPLIEDYETNEFTKWYEELTNVHINWEVAPSSNAKEKLNVVMTSGEYPDVILNMGISPTEQLIYGQQGIYLSLNDYIEEYGVETKQMFEDYPKVKQAVTAPND